MYKTLKYKKILVGIDFSEGARAAFYAALDIAKRHDAELWVVHVSEPIRSFDLGKQQYVYTKDVIERVEEGVHKRLDQLWAERGLEAVDRRKIYVHVEAGKADQVIVQTAADKDIDLIIVAASGAGGLATSLLGTTCERVVRHAPCTVLCYRANEEDSDQQPIMG